MSAASPPLSRGRRGRRVVAAARWAYLAAAALFLLYAADMVSRPVAWLVGFVPDDALYYLQIARHLAVSGRSTFDGLNPTNGYHPGWMVLLTAAATVFREPAPLLRAALALSLALHLLSSALVAAAGRRLLGPLWGWTAGACWLWNPLPLVLGLQAMESALLLATVAAVILVVSSRVLRRPREGSPARHAVILGAALAAAVWARTDMLVLAGSTLLLVAIGGTGWRHAPAGPRRAMAVLAGAMVVAALVPWWLFSWRVVGTPEQDSAAMKTLWGQALQQHLGWGGRLAGAHDFAHRAALLAFEGLLGRLGGLAATLELALVAVVALALARGTARARRLRWLLAWLGATAVATLLAYGAIISDVQVWYVAVPGLAAWLAAFAGTALVARRRPAAAAAWLAATAVLGFLTWLRPPVLYPWQRDVLRSLDAFEAQIPPDARVGCFNAGIPAYFGHRRVINLDGLVNHAVIPYWRAHRFEAYLADAGIEYIADEEGALRRALAFSSRAPRLEVLATTKLTGWPTGQRLLWRVEASP